MRAELISVGTELLLGEITDTNATTIAKALTEIGLDLIYRTTVGDNQQRIAQVIDIALDRVDVVITNGGLGPTVDDVTREAIAQATDRPLEFQPVLLEQVAERFKRFGVEMSENNRRQAYVPKGAIPIENPVGTAPIFILETERGVIMTLPGVPREMKHLLDKTLVPWLKNYLGETAIIKSLTLRTVGIGESQIDGRIADLMTGINPTVGLAAHSGQADIRITAKAKNDAEAQRMIEPVEAEVRQRLGDWIYGTGSRSIEEVVMPMLQERHETISCIEAGTGGLLAERLRKVGLTPETLIHSLMLETTDEVRQTVGSTETDARTLAQTAAQLARAESQATYGAAVVLHTTVDGITEAGVAVASEDRNRTRASSWSAERSDAPTWVSTHCLALLWRLLLKDTPKGDS